MKTFITKLAKQAGDEVEKHFLHHRIVKMKSKRQIVADADLISNKIIINAIKKKYPDHSILSEETGKEKRSSKYTWVIDPIDGTTNFSIGNPLFAVSIALFENDQPIVGVVYAPVMKEMYYAAKGEKAELNGKGIKVSKEKELNTSINTYCYGGGKKDIAKAVNIYKKMESKNIPIRRLGTAAIELGFIAAGRIESLTIPGLHSWDGGAGILLVRQAGGEVTDLKGKEWNLKSKDMVASNGKIHRQLLKFINTK